MGYYTQYSISLVEGSEDQYKEMLKDIDTLLGCSDMTVNGSVCAKWYDFETDMEELSRKYPDITVRLEGSGEDYGDLWQSFWHDGRSFMEPAHFTPYDDIKEQLQSNS